MLYCRKTSCWDPFLIAEQKEMLSIRGSLFWKIPGFTRPCILSNGRCRSSMYVCYNCQIHDARTHFFFPFISIVLKTIVQNIVLISANFSSMFHVPAYFLHYFFYLMVFSLLHAQVVNWRDMETTLWIWLLIFSLLTRYSFIHLS